MKRKILAVFIASIIVAGSTAGSAQVTHGKRTSSAANFFERAGAVKAGLSFGFGEHAWNRIIDTQTMFIRHTATELQRRTAEKNAKIYYAHLTPKKKADLKAKKIRYLLVPTVKSAETSPQAKEVRMTWDTQSESLVDKYVYEFENPPAVGTVAKVGDHAAESIP
jgi:deoxyribodipyrimidine photolyase